MEPVCGMGCEFGKLLGSVGALAITFIIQWVVIRTAVVSALKRYNQIKK